MRVGIKKRQNYLLVIAIICLILQDLLQMYIPIFQYLDEGIAVFGMVFYGLFLLKNNLIVNKKEIYVLLLMTFLILVGLISNGISGISRSPSAILMDIGNTFKFVLVFLGCLYMAPGCMNRKNVGIVAKFVKIYLCILAICAIINIFYDINISYDVRYGLRSFAFIYGIPGVVINHCTYMIVILMAERSICKKKNTFFIVLGLLVIVSTLRSRGFGLVALFCMLYYLIYIGKKKSLKNYLGAIAIVIGLIGSSQFKTYFLSNTSAPRALFLMNGIELALKNFPFGMGFATFGSFAAANYYSPLYYLLGFNNRFGMGPEGASFLSDNYWPTILGQFGFLGFILFVILLYHYFKLWLKIMENGKNRESRLVGWFVMLDILMSSIQSSYISHYSMVAIVFITMMFFNNALHQHKEGEKYDN